MIDRDGVRCALPGCKNRRDQPYSWRGPPAPVIELGTPKPAWQDTMNIAGLEVPLWVLIGAGAWFLLRRV